MVEGSGAAAARRNVPRPPSAARTPASTVRSSAHASFWQYTSTWAAPAAAHSAATACSGVDRATSSGEPAAANDAATSATASSTKRARNRPVLAAMRGS